MALKGKKKSRARGSQARRRPAAAPRPTSGGREKPRWYQTTPGLVIGFLVAMSVIIFVWWFIADSRSETQAREEQQAALETLTEDLRTVISDLTQLTNELATADGLKDDELADKIDGWKEHLSRVQSSLAALTSPPDLGALGAIVSQSTLLYSQTIDSYASLPDLEGKARETLSDSATTSFNAANNLFAVMIQLLDEARSEADMSASGLTAPASEPPAPTPEPTPEATQGGDGSGE
jgi:hypothetical protein